MSYVCTMIYDANNNFNLCACPHLLLHYQLHYIIFCLLNHLTESLKHTNFYNLLSEINLDLIRQIGLKCWCVRFLSDSSCSPLSVRVHIPREGNSTQCHRKEGTSLELRTLLNSCLMTVPEHYQVACRQSLFKYQAEILSYLL